MIKRTLTFIIAITITGSLYAQEQKSISQLADEAYAREEYAVAGALYKRQARRKGDRTPVNLLMKMARSYQQTGRFDEAVDGYRQIVVKPLIFAAYVRGF